MVIWRSPAGLIILGSFGAVLGGLFVLSQVLEILPDWFDKVHMARSWGLLVILGDSYYRRTEELSMLSLESSTLFFVLPSWVFGMALLILPASVFA